MYQYSKDPMTPLSIAHTIENPINLEHINLQVIQERKKTRVQTPQYEHG